MVYFLEGGTFDFPDINESHDDTTQFIRRRSRRRKKRQYYVNLDEIDYPAILDRKGQRAKMANSLDSSTMVNIAKNRSRLLKLADGIRTRKKPGNNKKSLRLDPAYTNIEHLVFGTYRARSATPDSGQACQVDHQVTVSASATPTRTRGGHFFRRTPYRSSDGSESERSSTVSSTDAKCECNRHSPSLVIQPSGGNATTTFFPSRTPLAGEKQSKGDEQRSRRVVENEGDSIHVASLPGYVGSYEAIAAPRAAGTGNTVALDDPRETGLREQPRANWLDGETMPTTVDVRRGAKTTSSTRKELRVQHGSSSSRGKIRKALSAEDGEPKTLSGSASGSSGGGGEDSGYQTSNGSSRRTSWKELSNETNLPSSHSDSKLQTRCDSAVRLNGAAYEVLPESPKGPFDRQHSCPSGIPKAKQPVVRLSSTDTVTVCAIEDTTVGTQSRNAALGKSSGSLPERKRYPARNSLRKSDDLDCAVPDLSEDPRTAVTCKIRITPPQTTRNMKGNVTRQISSTGNYKNLISGGAIQAGVKNVTKNGAVVKPVVVSAPRTGMNAAKSASSLNGSRSSLNGAKPSNAKVKTVVKTPSSPKGNAKKTDDVDKGVEVSETGRSVKLNRNNGQVMTPVSEQGKVKLFGLQSTVQKGERQRRPRQQAPLKEPQIKNPNVARWADMGSKNNEKCLPDDLTKFVPAEDTHVPAPEPFSFPDSVLQAKKEASKTTWAQLGKSRSIDGKSTSSNNRKSPDNHVSVERRQSSVSSYTGQYYSLDLGSAHQQSDCSSETVLEPVAKIPQRVTPQEQNGGDPRDLVETESKVVNGVTGIPIPRKISDAKAVRVMVPMPLPSFRLDKEGSSSLPVACDEEPGVDLMSETHIQTKIKISPTNSVKSEGAEPRNVNDKPPRPPPSPKTSQILLQTPPLPCRKRSLSVGSSSRHLDLRLLAAFQRYGDVTNLPENPEGFMSDIEEKDENSSSSASRATSEEPQEVFVDADWTLLGGHHRVAVVNGAIFRSPMRRRTTGSLGLERLLPIGPPVFTPTGSWKGTPCNSPGKDSLNSSNNVSVIACNFEEDSLSSAKSTPVNRSVFKNGHSVDKPVELEQPPANQTWEKTVTIETGQTNSHLVVGTNGQETSPLVKLREARTVDQVTEKTKLPPSAYRLMRNRPISRSERHLKTTSTPEFRAGSVEAIPDATTGGGSVRDVRRPWSEIYGEDLENRDILSQTNPNCFSVPNFPRFDGNGSPSAADSAGGSFFNRFSSIRATDSMLQKFRKTFSLRFQKARRDSATNSSPPPPLPASSPPRKANPEPEVLPTVEQIPVATEVEPMDSAVAAVTETDLTNKPNAVESELGSLWNLQTTCSATNVSGSPGSSQMDGVKDDGAFKLGLSVLRSSRDRKKLRKKDCRSSKCNSADSGIQVEGTCPGSDGATEPNSATESPAVLRRRAVSTSETSSNNKTADRPLSDYIDHIDLESVDEVTSLGGGKSVGDVFRDSSLPRVRDNLYCSPVRRTPSAERQMSTPPPIKLRSERKLRPRIRRQKGKSRLRRSISQPLDLEKMGFPHKGLDHGLSDHEGSRESTASSEEDFSSDNELYHSLRSPIKKQTILKEVYEDTITYAEALWDHVTIDMEELPFKAGEVIEVTDTSDKDWWWGSIGGRSGWFPAPFVRLRVSQEDTVEDCIIKMADGTLMTRNHAPRKMSISLLSNEQVRANVVREIVTTERDFVQHLRDVVEGYLRQVRRRPDMFTGEVISTIFGNIEAIYSFQSVFLKHLEACIRWQVPHVSEIGQCFLDHKESFKIYSEYCNNHPLAVSQLQELYSDQKYVQFFEACRLLQDMIDISLDGFLLTPVQKICKYPLQLAELLKYTKPDHPDYRTVTDALAAMRGVAQLVNERKRRMECLEKLVEWQKSIEGWEGPDILETSSVLIHSGEVTRVTSNWSRDITLFLFDHLLVYCKKDLLKRNTAVYKGRIDLNHCCVFDVEDGKDAQFGINLRNAWKIHCSRRDKWFLFYAKSPMEKSRWLQALREERQLGLEDKEQGFIVTNQAKKAAKLAVLNKSKTKRPRAKIPKGSRPHPDTAVVELLLDPPGPKTRSGSLPSNLSPSMIVNGSHARVPPTKKKGSGWFHFGSGKKSKK